MAKAPLKKTAAKSSKVAAPKAVVAKKIKAQEPKPVIIKATAPLKSPFKSAGGSYFYAVGKRKTAIASVRLYSQGKGSITINGRTFENYFPVLTDQDKILSPLRMTQTGKLFDVSVQVSGGGVHSQAEAVRHGIARALLEHDGNLRTTLKHVGFLTRDSRVKERKKYGLKKARRAPQFSKR